MTAPAAPHIYVRQNGYDIYVRWLPVADATDYIMYVSEVPFSAVLAQTYAVTGEADTDLFTSTAHGLEAGDCIEFGSLTGGTGLTEDTPYFIIAAGLTANAFQVALTKGGDAVEFDDDVTAGTWHLVLPPAYLAVDALVAADVADDGWLTTIAPNEDGLTFVTVTALNTDAEESDASNAKQVNLQGSRSGPRRHAQTFH